jgi:RNA polymerase sigma-70 factor (ECF subfamily)
MLTRDGAPARAARPVAVIPCAHDCAQLCTPRGLATAYAAHAGELTGYCHRALADHGLAEEITQEVFVKAWRHCARFDGRNARTGESKPAVRLRRWLFAIARNAMIDAARSRGRRPGVHPDPDRAAHQADPTDLFDRYDTAEQVYGRLARLSAEHRAILTAIFIEELRYEQAATRLGVPLGTVKSRVYYALRVLRAQVDPAQPQPRRRIA